MQQDILVIYQVLCSLLIQGSIQGFCDNTTYPLFNLLMPCPNEKHYATSIKMRPSTVVTTIGTLRYLNQNEQHYTTLCYPLFYFWKLCQNCSGHKYWNIALKVRSGRHGAIHITIDIKHSKVYKVSTTYLNQNETL